MAWPQTCINLHVPKKGQRAQEPGSLNINPEPYGLNFSRFWKYKIIVKPVWVFS